MTKPKRSKRAPSGDHPAVIAYREKLRSLSEHTSSEVTELDKQLQEYLDEIRSPPPPPPCEEDRPSHA